GIVVLSNYGNVDAGVILDAAMSALLGENGKPRAAPRAESAVSQNQPFSGTWTGFVRTPDVDVPLTLTVHEKDDIHAKLGAGLETVLSQARFVDGRLVGVMAGDLGVPGARVISLSLYLRDGVLKGAALTGPDPQLPYWVELRRTGGPNLS